MKTKKNTIKLTEGELKNIISESVKRVLKEAYYGEGGELIYDDGDFNNHRNTSGGNPFAWDGKYADGGSDMSYDELYDAGVSFKDAWHNFAKAITRSGFSQNNRQLVEQWFNAQKPLYGITTEIIFHAGGMYKED
jgi:hypothetical protein